MMFARHGSYMINLVYGGYALFFCVFSVVLTFQAQAADPSNMITTPDQIMSKWKDRLNLTEDQETRVKPVIEEFVNKRGQIMENGMMDAKTKRSSLQQLQWSTDMWLGRIFTEEQMAEYQRLREEENEKAPHGDIQQSGDMHHSRGSHSGGQIGF